MNILEVKYSWLLLYPIVSIYQLYYSLPNYLPMVAGLISHTALLAEKVSAKVRQLDLAKSRVAECQQRVHDLIDLRYGGLIVEREGGTSKKKLYKDISAR